MKIRLALEIASALSSIISSDLNQTPQTKLEEYLNSLGAEGLELKILETYLTKYKIKDKVDGGHLNFVYYGLGGVIESAISSAFEEDNDGDDYQQWARKNAVEIKKESEASLSRLLKKIA